jgi:hypothetical protein
MLLIGSLGLTVRTVLAISANSVFLYFLQPTLATVVVAGAFLFSVPAGRPLAAKLAGDFVPMPVAFRAHPEVRRYFERVTLLWAVVMFVNALVAFWLLISQPMAVFLAAKTAASLVITVSAVAVSALWFRWTMSRHGLLVERSAPQPVAVAP